MTFAQAIVTCYKNYFRFKGRAARSEFWWFVLFVVLATFALRIVDYWIFGINPHTGLPVRSFSNIFGTLSFLPMLAVGWRRMHDVGKPGWFILAPALLTLVFSVLSLGGVGLFAMLEESDALMKIAYFLGVVAFLVYAIISLALTLWTLWCLTQPSQMSPRQHKA